MFHVKHSLSDTITAIASPLGVGGVGVVRISGDQSIRIAEELIKDFPKKIEPRKVYLRWIFQNKKPIDEIVFYYMKAPKSFTGEDVVEIFCHSGLAVLESIVGLIIKKGARQAEPGEFTKRAFLNKKIDLTKAEAIVDLVSAQTEKSAGFAVNQLQGRLSKFADIMRKILLEELTKIEAYIDFEDELKPTKKIIDAKKINKIKKEILRLVETEKQGKIFRQGLATVIIGKPNVGKSSLLNQLLGEERAIVTSLPGTTRDSIEEVVNLKGIPLKIIDTAGIRHPKDKAEKFGVERTVNEVATADLALMVFDNSRPLDDWDRMVIDKASPKLGLAIINKVDLKAKLDRKKLKQLLKGRPICFVSAKTGQAMEALKTTLYGLISKSARLAGNSPIVVNERHRGCLLRAMEALDRMPASASVECLALDLKDAIISLGEITGEQVSEEVINGIFSRFCIGK